MADHENSDYKDGNSFYLNSLEIMKETMNGFKEQTQSDAHCLSNENKKLTHQNKDHNLSEQNKSPCLNRNCTDCYYPCPRCKSSDCIYWDKILTTISIRDIRKVHGGHSTINRKHRNGLEAIQKNKKILKEKTNEDHLIFLNAFIKKDKRAHKGFELCPYVKNAPKGSCYLCRRCKSTKCLYWELRLNFISTRNTYKLQTGQNKTNTKYSNKYIPTQKTFKKTLLETEINETKIITDQNKDHNLSEQNKCPCLNKNCANCYYPCPRCKSSDCIYWDKILTTISIRDIRKAHMGHTDINCKDRNRLEAIQKNKKILKEKTYVDHQIYLNAFIRKDNGANEELEMCPYVENASTESYQCQRCKSATCLYWELRLNFICARDIHKFHMGNLKASTINSNKSGLSDGTKKVSEEDNTADPQLHGTEMFSDQYEGYNWPMQNYEPLLQTKDLQT